ncbi:acyltransferase family protein [Hymenobacter fodinae]|uniref:Acyltransferase n=1 Tax=Hymenobacter fodinae TaxID=2510796 RepID=A0A4Z0P7E4_9BACT|nr:acyltransferase [Hymenobacter fodinae]TGE08344.1 acyltransferase [Hymenobacter fodinae]
MITSKKGTYYPALTGVRALAALMVFFFHDVGSLMLEPNFLIRFLYELDCGVSIFFVLSGFLITIRYQERIEPSWSWIKSYLRNRFARIYPIYILLTAITFIAWYLWPQTAFWPWSSFTGVDKLFSLITNLTLTRSFFEPMKFIGVATAWTLTVEETFYLLAPFILLTTSRKFGGLLLWLFGLLGVGVGLVYIHPLLPVARDYGFMASINFMLSSTFFGRCSEFLCGIGLAWWLRQEIPTGKKTWTATGLLSLLLCMGISAGFPIEKSMGGTVVLLFLLQQLALPLSVCLFFAGLLREQTKLRLLLETKLFDILGKSSYIFYLLHLGLLNDVFSQHISGNIWVRLAAYTLISIALYQVVEAPLHKWLKSPQVRPTPRPMITLATATQRSSINTR